MSRQPTWDLACQLQAEMFDAAARAGGLEVQLVYYRGHGEARASRWVSDAAALKRLMTGIACHGGLTQIGRVLEHAVRVAAKAPLAALVFVGDAMEESADALCHEAGRLGAPQHPRLHVPRGRRPARSPRPSARSPALPAAPTCRSTPAPRSELRALLGAVGAFAAGGRAALEASGTGAAKRLLADLRP